MAPAEPEPAEFLSRLPVAVRRRLDYLARAAGAAWLVGGTVRDLLLGLPGLDVDVVVEADAAALARRLGLRLAKSTAFGTATIAWDDGSQWDLVTARRETYPEPAALPVTEPADLDADLRRRDFSFNCLALSPGGDLVDPTGGLADLRAGLLRALHERSFVDDPTRLYRAARYAARLGFGIERRTAEQMAAAVPYVDRLTPDRLRHELERSLSEEAGEAQVVALEAAGLLARIDPALAYHPRRTFGVETLLADWPAEFAGVALWFVRLLALIPKDEARAAAARLAARLGLDRRLREAATAFGELIVRPLESDRPSAVCERLGPMPLETLLAYAARKREQRPVVRRYLEEWRWSRPLLNGTALQAGGIAPGPGLGRILAALRRARLDGEVETIDDEWALARQLATRSE